jgi:ABC-2 type transport system ATP-binding protein
MSIVVRNLVKQYGLQKAVDDISFEINSGEIVGFLGPNGAGKSTTMKVLTGYLNPNMGSAEVAGFNVVDKPIEVKRQVGYLPEHNPLYPEMYVKEYLHFIAALHGIKKEAKSKVAEMIEKTGLTDQQNKKIGQLSKGYKQRVGLAQAMIHDPSVLILDEPTSGLDPNQIKEIRKLITEFGKNRTILLSTHIMQEVKAMCNRVIIINKGQIVADDTTHHLQDQFSGSQILKVQFKNKMPEQSIKALTGVKSVTVLPNNTYRIEATPESAIKELIFKLAVEKGNVILEQSQEEQSLEEIFQQLTK